MYNKFNNNTSNEDTVEAVNRKRRNGWTHSNWTWSSRIGEPRIILIGPDRVGETGAILIGGCLQAGCVMKGLLVSVQANLRCLNLTALQS